MAAGRLAAARFTTPYQHIDNPGGTPNLASGAGIPLEGWASCDLSGDWTTGWAANFSGKGGPGTAVPRDHITVRAAITPFGTPHAQYVVDYTAALGLHPNMQTCLGNGTCTSGQFGRARAVNSSSPACSFIEWPPNKTGVSTGGSWCKSPACGHFPLPPPPPPPPLMPWPATYTLARSTMTFVDGNHTGPDNATRAVAEARYGMVTFGWETDVCATARPSTPQRACTYAGAEAALDAAAARLKAINPDVKVVLYRNTELGLSVYKDQCEKMYDPSYSGFYLKNSSGALIVERAAFPGDGISICPGEPHAGAWGMDQMFTDFRNASAAAWFVGTVVGRVAKSSHADGVWFDDPSGVGAEHPAVVKAFTPAQLQQIRAATAVTLQQAAESLIAAGKPLNFNVPKVGLRGYQPVIDTGSAKGRDTQVCIAALRAGAALGNIPALYTISYFASPAAGGRTVANDFRQHLAAFLLIRGEYSWFGNGWISTNVPAWYPEWDWDVGTPIGGMVELPGGAFSRVWSKGTVVLNCTSWEVELPFK